MQLTRNVFTPSTKLMLIANGLGAVLYVFAASRGGWAVPQERAAGISAITGEPFVWFLNILPVITLFFVINLIWGLRILKSRKWYVGQAWLIAAAVWAIAVTIDFAHH